MATSKKVRPGSFKVLSLVFGSSQVDQRQPHASSILLHIIFTSSASRNSARHSEIGKMQRTRMGFVPKDLYNINIYIYIDIHFITIWVHVSSRNLADATRTQLKSSCCLRPRDQPRAVSESTNLRFTV